MIAIVAKIMFCFIAFFIIVLVPFTVFMMWQLVKLFKEQKR